MIDWISKKQRDKKRKEAHEQALRKSIAEKISRYEDARTDSAAGADGQDFTELYVDGKKVRVAKQQITVTDV